MTTDAIAHAVAAVAAADEGDAPAAQVLLASAQRQARRAARRDRQVVEIAALVVAGQRGRAAGLALEHAAAFPEDAALLARVTGGTAPWDGGPSAGETPLTATARAVEGPPWVGPTSTPVRPAR